MTTSFIADIVRGLPPAVAIFLISLGISFLITIVYKFTTNQKLMKMLHADMKSLRDEIKNTKDTSQATELNKRLMEKTMQQIMHSMKSTFITIIPMFLIFGWMSGHIAFDSVAPNEEFTASLEFEHEVQSEATLQAETLEILSEPTQQVNGQKAEWKLKGDEGEHTVIYSYGDEIYKRQVIISNGWDYEDPYLEKDKKYLGIIPMGDKVPIPKESDVKRAAIELQPIHPFGNFSIFGHQPGWLLSYLFFTLALTFPVRKLLRVH